MDNQELFRRFMAFIVAVHETTYALTKGITPDHLTPLQYKMLEYIAVSQPVTLSEIGDCLHISPPNTSRELKKLMEKGLCAKETDPTDRRRQDIVLSAEGQRLMDEVFASGAIRFHERIGAVSVEEAGEIVRALELLQRKVFH